MAQKGKKQRGGGKGREEERRREEGGRGGKRRGGERRGEGEGRGEEERGGGKGREEERRREEGGRGGKRRGGERRGEGEQETFLIKNCCLHLFVCTYVSTHKCSGQLQSWHIVGTGRVGLAPVLRCNAPLISTQLAHR